MKLLIDNNLSYKLCNPLLQHFDEWSLLKGCPPKIIHLLCGNQTTLFILNLIVTNKSIIQNFIESDSNDCILKLHV
jgi:predicted nuclease of predicted toxin-antitoxin system